MSVLIEGLPDEALCKQDNPGEVPWGTTEELLAQLIEEVSVLTSKHERKEPLQLTRPGRAPKAKKAQQPVLAGSPQTGMKAHGLAGMLAAAEIYGAVRAGHE